MITESRPITFEQFVKMSGKWDSLPAFTKRIITAKSANRKIVFVPPRRSGKTYMNNLFKEYETRILNK